MTQSQSVERAVSEQPAQPQEHKLNANAAPFASQLEKRQQLPWRTGAPYPGTARTGPPTAMRSDPRRLPPTVVGHLPCSPPPRSASPGAEEAPSVVTPWYPDGKEKAAVTLGDELVQAALLLSLTETEKVERAALLEKVKAAVRSRWPDAAVVPYGSHAVGLAGGSSALDISVCGCGTLAADDVVEAAAEAGTVRSVLTEAEAAFTQIECADTGVLANVSFAAAEAEQPARTVSAILGWLQQYPAVVPVHAVLRQVFTQTGNLDVSSGGISAHCLLVMLISRARGGHADDPAALLTDFCTTFGSAWDFAAHSVDPVTAEPAPRQHPADSVSVMDPIMPGNNLAAGCTRLFAVRAQLQHCAAALTRWSNADTASPGQRGYKGKTPLSSILSHQRLQGRVEAVARDRGLRHDDHETAAALRALQQTPSPPISSAASSPGRNRSSQQSQGLSSVDPRVDGEDEEGDNDDDDVPELLADDDGGDLFVDTEGGDGEQRC